jgi:hypothetical protein
VGWLDAIGWIGSALLIWSLLQTRILRLRWLNLVGCFVLIFFNAMVRVWPMVGLNVVLAVVNIYYLRMLTRTRHDETTYAVVEVALDGAFLAHVLATHRTDIAKFNPGFDPAGLPSGVTAFIVVRGDQLVGLMLISDAGEGVAQIELDYVTAPYRDFTPGEFVFRRSQLLTSRGFHRVVSRPGMVAPYYGKVGFQRIGESYCLDLPAMAG